MRAVKYLPSLKCSKGKLSVRFSANGPSTWRYIPNARSSSSRFPIPNNSDGTAWVKTGRSTTRNRNFIALFSFDLRTTNEEEKASKTEAHIWRVQLSIINKRVISESIIDYQNRRTLSSRSSRGLSNARELRNFVRRLTSEWIINWKFVLEFLEIFLQKKTFRKDLSKRMIVHELLKIVRWNIYYCRRHYIILRF